MIKVANGSLELTNVVMEMVQVGMSHTHNPTSSKVVFLAESLTGQASLLDHIQVTSIPALTRRPVRITIEEL